jgi:hypothetical protein
MSLIIYKPINAFSTFTWNMKLLIDLAFSTKLPVTIIPKNVVKTAVVKRILEFILTCACGNSGPNGISGLKNIKWITEKITIHTVAKRIPTVTNSQSYPPKNSYG